VHLIDGMRVLAWFAERWGVGPEELDVELAERGFSSRDELVAAGKPLYMFAKFRSADCALRLGTPLAA